MSAVLALPLPSAPAWPHEVPALPESARAFARDVLDGLARPRKSIPCTWLYDHRGSQLFERITALPEYYPARTERWILERCAAAIAELAGPRACVIELGSGSSRKTSILLQALAAPAAYLPIDVSAQFLAEATAALRRRWRGLAIEPVVADFTRLEALPAAAGGGRRLVFFPGSTIGNFTPDEAQALLDRIGRLAGPDALLVVGVDTTQDPALLIPAYDDAQGVTAAFNRNLLARINRELGGDFSLGAFRHQVRWDAAQQRIEMHLVSEYTQQVTVLGRSFRFALGESIHTESACKYGVARFQALGTRAGWTPRQLWTDGRARFAVHVFERAPA